MEVGLFACCDFRPSIHMSALRNCCTHFTRFNQRKEERHPVATHQKHLHAGEARRTSSELPASVLVKALFIWGATLPKVHKSPRGLVGVDADTLRIPLARRRCIIVLIWRAELAKLHKTFRSCVVVDADTSGLRLARCLGIDKTRVNPVGPPWPTVLITSRPHICFNLMLPFLCFAWRFFIRVLFCSPQRGFGSC